MTEDEQVGCPGSPSWCIGMLAIGRGILANGQNVAFLVALAFAVAAAANLPTILYSLLLAAVHHPGRTVEHVRRPDLGDRADRLLPGGLGRETVDDPKRDFARFPLANPGIVSIPLAFVLGIVGTLT